MSIAAELWLRDAIDTVEEVFKQVARNFTLRLAEKLAQYICSLTRRAESLATPETECLLYATYWFRPILSELKAMGMAFGGFICIWGLHSWLPSVECYGFLLCHLLWHRLLLFAAMQRGFIVGLPSVEYYGFLLATFCGTDCSYLLQCKGAS